MRASILVPCALAVALAGCKRGDVAHRTETTSAASAAPTAAPPEDTLEGAAEPFESFFDPDAEGHAALVVRKDSPNMRYAQLGRDACFAELGRRGIAFEEAPPTEWARRPPAHVARVEKTAAPAKKTKPPVKQRYAAGTKQTKQGKQSTRTSTTKPTKKASGRTASHRQPPAKPAPNVTATAAADPIEEAAVLAPVRLAGPLHGISIHSSVPEKKRATSTFEIFDCRLVLALDDFFATVLAKHDIVEVVHMSAFRSQRDRGCTPKYTGKQHCGALAVDVGTFKKKDGSVLDVDKDFNGRIGTATCTTGTGPNPVTPAATELWDIVCESARRGLFHVLLTPNFNTEHKNHFHLEVTPDVQWMLIK